MRDFVQAQISGDALGWVLDIAYEDQTTYLDLGSPELDYRAEWPEIAGQRAAWCRNIASNALIVGEAERWEDLAERFERSAQATEDTFAEPDTEGGNE